ncbi:MULTISPECIES: sigma-70 family RNA polymerase sigma factor [unclassified Streptomyces]|uniref:sigma-70 family RNA polymerase sigma factor n=1 Tax=unclassified Streptomyces TaxID=2593676 RepID=UPI000B88A57E|nr:sigma-70 family RNA polymerase sigma factor [Streptomyces sp. DvalAA-14]MYS23958.1 sigma-70 family RNA polymerase sigma factor [Streptomyces sp. SID4948]
MCGAPRPATPTPYARLGPLLTAEAAAEAPPGAGIEAADLEQAVWLRLLELDGPPAEPGHWVRGAVRDEARAAARRIRRERPCGAPDAGPSDPGDGAAATGNVEDHVLAAERQRAVLAAVRLLPGRCPQIVAALMNRADPTYAEIARELGISQGSLGPLRSRCLGCLRSILNSRVGSPVRRGNAR